MIKKVYQDPLEESCFEACVSSITGISIESLPPKHYYVYFNQGIRVDIFKHFNTIRDNLYESLGITLYESKASGVDRYVPEDEYYIGLFINPLNRFNGHAVVCKNGQVVHDPIPKGINNPFKPYNLFYGYVRVSW